MQENYYRNHLGVAFGFELEYVEPSEEYPEGAWFFWETFHSFRNFGLYPKSKPKISCPKVQSQYVEVPGRNGLLDFTESLTNDVRYYNRDGVFEFVQTGGRKVWDVTYHKLKNELHGKKKKIIIDEERDGYYFGRLTVEAPKYDDKKGLATFTIKANLEPYKRAITTNSQPWLWDNLNFETGWIPQISEGLLQTKYSVAAEVLFFSFNGFNTSDPDYPSGDPLLDGYGNTMPFVPNFIVKKDSENPDPQTGAASLNLVYPTDEATIPLTVDGFNVLNPPNGWENVSLDYGDNIEKVPDFVVREKPMFAAIYGTNGMTSRRIIACDFRAGWL